jgi:hypothetical protein
VILSCICWSCCYSCIFHVVARACLTHPCKQKFLNWILVGCTTTPSLISFQMLQKGCPNSCAWNQHIFPKGKYTHQHWWKWEKKTTKWSSYNSVCIQLGIERNKIELVDGGGAFEGCELLCTQTWRKSDDIMSDITLIGVNHVIVEEGWWWSVWCNMSPADWCQQIAYCFDIQVGSTSQITSLRCGFQPRWTPAIGPF